MAETDAGKVLEDLLSTLEAADQAKAEAEGDAIDRVLGSPARVTSARSLRDAEEVRAFRTALTDGIVQIDTVNRLLRLIDAVVARVMT